MIEHTAPDQSRDVVRHRPWNDEEHAIDALELEPGLAKEQGEALPIKRHRNTALNNDIRI